jgi:hypothetical protein
MLAAAFIATLVIAIFVVDACRRWWRQNEWKRHWRARDRDGV